MATLFPTDFIAWEGSVKLVTFLRDVVRLNQQASLARVYKPRFWMRAIVRV